MDLNARLLNLRTCSLLCAVCPPNQVHEGWLSAAAAAATKLLQSCPTLYDPPGSPVPGILQARTLEWVAIAFSSASK